MDFKTWKEKNQKPKQSAAEKPDKPPNVYDLGKKTGGGAYGFPEMSNDFFGGSKSKSVTNDGAENQGTHDVSGGNALGASGWHNSESAFYKDAQRGAEKSASGEIPEDLSQKISGYMGKSEDELMKEFLSSAARLKSEGKLNQKEIQEFYDKVKGFFNAEQLERLKSLLKMLEV
jgi:hypothetical protein